MMRSTAIPMTDGRTTVQLWNKVGVAGAKKRT